MLSPVNVFTVIPVSCCMLFLLSFFPKDVWSSGGLRISTMPRRSLRPRRPLLPIRRIIQVFERDDVSEEHVRTPVVMDSAAKGAQALTSKDFTAALDHYSNALKTNPQAVDYYIQRSTANTRLSSPNHAAALSDAEIALMLANKRGKRELIVEAQLRRGIALFSLQRYSDAKQCFQWVEDMNPKNNALPIWKMKVEAKLKNLLETDDMANVIVTRIPDVEIPITAEGRKVTSEQQQDVTTATNGGEAKAAITTSEAKEQSKPEGVQTPANKIRHEWYQTPDTVVVSLFAKGVPKDKTTIDIQSRSLTISFPLPTGSDFNFELDPLFAPIDHTASTSKIMSTKVEFVLKKVTVGQKWASIESTEPVPTDQNQQSEGTASDEVKRAILADKAAKGGPLYPSSSKSGPKNWDKVAADLTKKPKKKEGDDADGPEDGLDDDIEGGDPVNGFFQSIYKNADADTRRAMMKSYQESNGTALSTNWAEVGKAPVQTQPPDGMEAKKWSS